MLRPLARTLTGACTVFAAFWGAVVSEDLIWFFAAIAAVGALNLWLGIVDDRRIKAKDTQIDRLTSTVEEIAARHLGTPLHLQDLAGLSTAVLRGQVADFALRLRAFESLLAHDGRTELGWFADDQRIRHRFSRDEQSAHFWTRGEKSRELADAREEQWRYQFRAEALALWDELVRRVGNDEGDKHFRGMLESGSVRFFMGELTSSFEMKARRLPDA